ncbi:MAG: hypothetical protein ACRYG4_15675 [Janthinobacterium lividum]
MDDDPSIEIVDLAITGEALEHPASLELYWPSGLLLDDDGTAAYLAADHERPDLDLHELAAPQLAIYSKVEQGAVAHTAMLIQVEAYGPDLSWLERPLGSYLPACIPSPSIGCSWMEL